MPTSTADAADPSPVSRALPPGQVAALVARLRDPAEPDRDLVINEMRGNEVCDYLDEMVGVLDAADDPWVAAAALQYLCFCGHARDYRDRVEHHLAGLAWYAGGALEIAAIGGAGEIMATDPEPSSVARRLVALARAGDRDETDRGWVVATLQAALERLGTPQWPDGDAPPEFALDIPPRSSRGVEVLRRVEARWGPTPPIAAEEVAALVARLRDPSNADRAAALDRLREGFAVGLDAEALDVLDGGDPAETAAALRYLRACSDPAGFRLLVERYLGPDPGGDDDGVVVAALGLAGSVLAEGRGPTALVRRLLGLARDASRALPVRVAAVAALRRENVAGDYLGWPPGDDHPDSPHGRAVLRDADAVWPDPGETGQ